MTQRLSRLLAARARRLHAGRARAGRVLHRLAVVRRGRLSAGVPTLASRPRATLGGVVVRRSRSAFLTLNLRLAFRALTRREIVMVTPEGPRVDRRRSGAPAAARDASSRRLGAAARGVVSPRRTGRRGCSTGTPTPFGTGRSGARPRRRLLRVPAAVPAWLQRRCCDPASLALAIVGARGLRRAPAPAASAPRAAPFASRGRAARTSRLRSRRAGWCSRFGAWLAIPATADRAVRHRPRRDLRRRPRAHAGAARAGRGGALGVLLALLPGACSGSSGRSSRPSGSTCLVSIGGDVLRRRACSASSWRRTSRCGDAVHRPQHRRHARARSRSTRVEERELSGDARADARGHRSQRGDARATCRSGITSRCSTRSARSRRSAPTTTSSRSTTTATRSTASTGRSCCRRAS